MAATKLTCTKPATAKPIMMPCPMCGEQQASISVCLAGLGEGEEFTCHDCDGVFGTEQVREFIARWTKVLGWIAIAPDFGDE